MALEIEVKLKLDDPEALRDRLTATGGRPSAAVFETNHIFDAVGGALRRGGCALRVREAATIGGGPRSATLTFKGPRQGGEFKSREELETTVGDAAVLVALLARLGFVEKVVYEKRREAWQIGDCEVVIDDLPQLGWFAEIEGPSEAAVRECRSRLKLDSTSVSAESYVELAARHGAREDSIAALRFS